jgi:hypothetical protein
MSESIASLPPIEPTDKSDAARFHRWRFQFSLRSLFLFILIVALILTSVLMYRRMSNAERELVTLRNIAGYLKIDDESLFHAINLDSNEPFTWRWRVYLPAGHKYSWRFNYGDIPANGMSKYFSYTTDGSASNKGSEIIVHLSPQKDPYNNWLIKLTRQSVDGGKHSTTFTTSNDDIIQLLQANMTEGECLAEGKTISCKLDKPIIFLKRRIGENQPNGSWKSSQNPMPGIMFWLEVVP